MNELYEWWELTQQLKITKARELELRKKLFAEHFPDATEGTNRCDIPGDSVLVANYPYRYTLDEDAVLERYELVSGLGLQAVLQYAVSTGLVNIK